MSRCVTCNQPTRRWYGPLRVCYRCAGAGARKEGETWAPQPPGRAD